MKKELIDFLKWIQEHPFEIHKYDNEELVDLYIKSIDSEASSKTPSVSKNEAQEKSCYNELGDCPDECYPRGIEDCRGCEHYK